MKILFLFTFLLYLGCTREIKTPQQTGVMVTKERISGKTYYRILSVAKASEQAIQKGSFAMKQASACESAKVFVRQKIRELTNNPQATERIAESQGIRMLSQGDYCEVNYLLDAELVSYED